VRKCPYCDFNSHRLPPAVDEPRFVDAVLADLDAELARAPVGDVASLFLGGGTPSLMSGAALTSLLDGVAARVSIAVDCEITLEANPGAVDAGRFRAYRAAGVNRLSIGVQSLAADKLRALGRIHSPDDARRALSSARAAGFDNVNVDLMYGLPGQTLADALQDLDGALALAPEHLSWYQLTVEPNTPFYHRPPDLPDDETVGDIAEAGLDRLQAAGYARYEVSAFATAGRRCRHNLNYWHFGDYLGIGPGAHGKRTLGHGCIVRRSKRRSPQAYLARPGAAALSREWELSAQDRSFEFMMNALRLVDGVDARCFTTRTGLSLDAIAGARASAIERGLLAADPRCLRPTPTGLRYLNDLLDIFLPD
jgi:oxygen-independent coproporphyrinogen-3 oxidase